MSARNLVRRTDRDLLEAGGMAVSISLDHLLTHEERQAVGEFVEALHRQYPDRVQDMILFGSKARGEDHPDSDIDILILVDDDDWRFSHAISRIAARISLNYDVLVSITEDTLNRFMEYSEILPFYKNIKDEGITIYGE